MALGGKMHHRPGLMLCQEAPHQLTVGDVTPDKKVPRVISQRREIPQVAGVGETVQVDDAGDVKTARRQHEICPDETGAPGDQPGILRMNRMHAR